jgi:hypothetical protein
MSGVRKVDVNLRNAGRLKEMMEGGFGGGMDDTDII